MLQFDEGLVLLDVIYFGVQLYNNIIKEIIFLSISLYIFYKNGFSSLDECENLRLKVNFKNCLT